MFRFTSRFAFKSKQIYEKSKKKALTMDSHLTDEYKQTRSRQLQVESADPVNIRNVKFWGNLLALRKG